MPDSQRSLENRRRRVRERGVKPTEERRHIEKVALQLFLRLGNDVTITKVAEAAGTSAATVRRHYGTSERLLARIQDGAAERLRRRLLPLAAEDLSFEQILEVFDSVIDLTMEEPYDPLLLHVYITTYKPRLRRPADRDPEEKIYDLLLSAFHSAEEQDAIRNDCLELAQDLLRAALLHAVRIARPEDYPPPPDGLSPAERAAALKVWLRKRMRALFGAE